MLAQVLEVMLEQQDMICAISKSHKRLIAAFEEEHKKKFPLYPVQAEDAVQHSADVLTDRIQRLSELVRTDQA